MFKSATGTAPVIVPIALLATAGLLFSGGCATSSTTPSTTASNHCTEAVETARAAGQSGQALSAIAFSDEPSDACRADVEQAWRSGLAQYCQPQRGFDTAYRGEDQAAACQQQAFVQAYGLGRTLYQLQAEQAELERRIAELENNFETDHHDRQQELTRLRGRLITIQRDLPEWLTLARLEGFLPPAVVPDQPAATEYE